ncbi:MAG TPA: thiamine pyrophosphate-dependent enzyme [Casimicrobiaceae bacterium]|nr:thiamine pyrophosphate-dependent enzyme [Casimicrobiaceae bacterium]
MENWRQLRELLLIRACDLLEERLLRQGKGWIHIPGLGHEALAAIAESLEPEDLLFLYYRDRALMQARGVRPVEMAREYLATSRSTSKGRMMPVHGSYHRLGIFPPATPTASQCLPAVGAAWGMRIQGRNGIVLCTVGDASTRQGDFYEALAFAIQERLPVAFVVEDNGYGISTPTQKMLPFRLGIFSEKIYRHVDGRSVDAVYSAGRDIITMTRRGDGPSVLWVEVDRISSHTNSDDHRVYRSRADIEAMKARDPVEAYAQTLIKRGDLTQVELEALRTEANAEADSAYREAENEPGPLPTTAAAQLFGAAEGAGYQPPFPLDEAASTMVGALNTCLREALDRFPDALVFGQDVEDPKGGVFGFTRGLSTRFPGRVINSPLAEATIVGAGVGLAACGLRPIFELQFIDFIAPAFSQLINQLATLRWRSNGDWTCPAIFYAPYGAYLPAGGTWHSQSNEAFWTHIPGIRVAVPSTPADVVGLLWTALNEGDPTILLIPKHIMRVRHKVDVPRAIGFGRAREVQAGKDVTVVTWGNCVEIVEEASTALRDTCSVEIIDLRSLVPCDWTAIEASVAKTGRLVVVNEDARTGSFGQTVVTEMTNSQVRFNRLLSQPLLVARADTHIPFNPTLEYAVLPDAARVTAAVLEVLK